VGSELSVSPLGIESGTHSLQGSPLILPKLSGLENGFPFKKRVFATVLDFLYFGSDEGNSFVCESCAELNLKFLWPSGILGSGADKVGKDVGNYSARKFRAHGKL